MAAFEPVPDGLLNGVRILSLGTFVAGNICPLLLAELGADVVKVELRERPEALRSYDTPDQAEVFEPSGVRTTVLFAGMTRNMRSVCIEMKSPAGCDAFRDLVERADVVIENMGPGKMESWGCSFEDLRVRNPRLVLVSISGYGRTGPMAGYRAYALNINNYLGLTAAWALDGTHFDFVAGIHGASAVVAGLAQVEHGAPGVYIDLAQTESGAAIMAPLYLDFLANGREWCAEPNEVPGALFSGVIRCDGTDAWLAIELEDAGDWESLCRLLGRNDLKFENAGASPTRQALQRALEDWTRALTPLQATFQLQQAGLAAGPVQNSEDLWRDAQLRSRGCFAEIVHPDVGLVEYPGSPSRLSKTPGRVRHRGPRLGEHTRMVLTEWMDLGDTELGDLERIGAIWQPEVPKVDAPQ